MYPVVDGWRSASLLRSLPQTPLNLLFNLFGNNLSYLLHFTKAVIFLQRKSVSVDSNKVSLLHALL